MKELERKKDKRKEAILIVRLGCMCDCACSDVLKMFNSRFAGFFFLLRQVVFDCLFFFQRIEKQIKSVDWKVRIEIHTPTSMPFVCLKTDKTRKKQTNISSTDYGFMILSSSILSILSVKLLNHLCGYFWTSLRRNWKSPFIDWFSIVTFKALDHTNRSHCIDLEWNTAFTRRCRCFFYCSGKTCSR